MEFNSAFKGLIFVYLCAHAVKSVERFNPLNAELNPICHLLTLLGAHHIFHVSRIRVNARQWILNAIGF